MSKKTSEARKDAFFAALSETGNQTISAEWACVSRSWVTLHRSSDPAFKVRMEATIAQARERLSAAGGEAGLELGFQAGDELVIRGCKGRLSQVQRAKPGHWTPRLEARFLGMIQKNCNVKAACKALGVSTQSAYYRRKRWPAFDRRWEEAIRIGVVDLEYAQVEQGCNFLEGVEPDADAIVEPVSMLQAIQLLGRYKNSSHAERRHRNWRYRPRELEEVRDSILRKLEAIASHEGRDEISS